MKPEELRLCALVQKTGGDYKFIGHIITVFTKLNGTSCRCVVENSDGVLHIFSPTQLQPVEEQNEQAL